MQKPKYPNLVDKTLIGRNVAVQTTNGVVLGRLLAYEHLKPHSRVDVIETKDGVVIVNVKHVELMTIHDGVSFPKIKQAGLIWDGSDDEPKMFIDFEGEGA